jgi:hypothetical protein
VGEDAYHGYAAQIRSMQHAGIDADEDIGHRDDFEVCSQWQIPAVVQPVIGGERRRRGTGGMTQQCDLGVRFGLL